MFMMGRSAKVLLGMMIVLFPATVLAQALPRFEVTPFAGFRVGGTFVDSVSDAEIELKEGSSFGVSLNMRADPNTQYEITFSHQDTEFDIGSLTANTTNLDVAVDYLQIGGTYLLEGQVARPYMVATLGLARIDPDDAVFNTENYFAFSIGGGWKLWPTKRFGLRLEGRFYGSFVDSDTSVFCISSGGTTCLIQSDADVLWQWEMTAGASWRF